MLNYIEFWTRIKRGKRNRPNPFDGSLDNLAGCLCPVSAGSGLCVVEQLEAKRDRVRHLFFSER
jgi:hypothetical protein